MSTAVPVSLPIPLVIGQPGDFAAIRSFFHQSGFDDVTFCRELQIADMSELGKVKWEPAVLERLSGPLSWCVDVFVRGLQMEWQKSRVVCGDEVLSAFTKLGLLREAKNNPTLLVCPVWLYPVDGFVVVSDRRDNPDGGPVQAAEDVVFPAIYGGTLRFLKLLPGARGGDALDLCGGSGIGALHFTRTASVAGTADLTERSAFFAKFNGLLNGVPMESHCGDLYEPVAGRQFDLISAHPPFVPATGQHMVYRDGGENGEAVTRRIIEGLPTYLKPGGTCVILCVACDTQEKAFEKRASDWLGSAAEEFDIVFGLEKKLSVDEVVDSIRRRSVRMTEEEGKQMHARLRSSGTSRFVYGATFLRRYTEKAKREPIRIQMSTDGVAEDFERLLQWRLFSRKDGFAEWLRQSRPRLSPRMDLTVKHVVKDGTLLPALFEFSVEGGFEAALRLDGWIVPLLTRLEGARSVNEVFDAAKERNELPDGFLPSEFAELVGGMIERGFLLVDFPRSA